MARYDAIVIGAGHNGLVCGAYLARAGLKTLVVERAQRIGGACVTDEIAPGFWISGGAHSLALPDVSILRDLEVDVELIAKDPRAFVPRTDGGGLFLWADRERTSRAIADIAPGDAAEYERFTALFDEAAARLRPLFAYPATKKQLRRAFRRSQVEDLYARTVTASIAAVCREHFDSDLLQGAMASSGVIGSAAGPETPGTAYVFLDHHARGPTSFVRGGLGALTDALADAVRAAGGEVRVGAEVARVKLDRRRVGGVVLSSGEEIDAPAVCSSADPHRTLGFADDAAWLPEFVQDVDLLPSLGTAVKVNCALGGLPRFTGSNGDAPGPEHCGTVTIAPSIDYLEAGCRAASEGRVPDELFCKVVFESVADPTMAPDGKHTMSVFAQYVPYRFAEGSWGDRRDEVGDRVIATLERYAPGLAGLIEERVVLGPPDIEARFGATGGHIYHGESLPDWSFDDRPARGWNRYRTPLPGLYICGAGAHPGGGISGVPGRNAARSVLADRVAGLAAV